MVLLPVGSGSSSRVEKNNLTLTLNSVRPFYLELLQKCNKTS